MIFAPKSGESILDWASKLVAELKPLLAATGAGGLEIRKSGASWRFVAGGATATTRPPWKVYASPDATGTAAWRTVRVHAGTINDVHPRTKGAGFYSDDTDTTAASMDMVLDASSTYYIVAVQTRHTANGSGFSIWDMDKTYLYCTKTAPAFPGHYQPAAADVPDIYRNAYFRCVAKAETAADTGDGAKVLTITQILDANLVAPFTPPAFWEPVIVVANPDTPGANEWRTAKIYAAGFLTPSVAITGIGTAQTFAAGATGLLWLAYTLDTGTGEATAVALASGTTLPTPTTPAPGLAPATVYRLLSSVEVPGAIGKSVVTLAETAEELRYQIACAGFDCNDSGGLVTLMVAEFS